MQKGLKRCLTYGIMITIHSERIEIMATSPSRRSRISFIRRTLSEILAVALMEDDKDVEYNSV